MTEHIMTPPRMQWSYGTNADQVLKCIYAVQQNSSLVLTGHHTQGARYDFAKLGDIKKAIMDTLDEYQCIILHTIESIEYDNSTRQLRVGKDTTPQPRITNVLLCTGQVILMNSQDKEDWVSLSCYGTKIDYSSDKTMGAHTIFRRYSMMQMFALDVAGDDPDSDDNSFQQGSNDLLAPPPAPNAVSTTSSAKFSTANLLR